MRPFRSGFLLSLLLLAPSCGDDPAPGPGDFTPPARITDLSASVAKDQVTLRWTAPGDNNMLGRAFRYDVRYAGANLPGTWSSASSVGNLPAPSEPGEPDSLTTRAIPSGQWEIGVRTSDVSGNWSAVSNIATITLDPDTIPPATVDDLAIRSTVQGFYLTWTAPGGDGHEGRSTRYEIRYASGSLASQWEAGTVVSDPPTPGPAGQGDSTAVLGIGWGPWEFGIRSADAAGNWSATSNIVTTTVPEDTIPPAAVTDLAVDLLTQKAVVLSWTAVGDDGGIGQAAEYDLRYALTPISEQTWSAATRMHGVSSPSGAGERERFGVGGLQEETTYHFALRVLDEFGNASALSNQVSGSLPSPIQLTFVTDLDLPVGTPDWSPDGQSIAFTRQTGEETVQVLVMPATGGTATPYTPASGRTWYPTWSPDGTRMIIVQDESILALMDAEPNAPAQPLADYGPLFVASPRWSPDGTRLFYYAVDFWQPTLNSEMYTLSLGGGSPELLKDDSRHGGLDVSPDGSLIAYGSNAAGTYDLWVMPSTGGAATRITSDPGREWSPTWSPDGTRIAYQDWEEFWVIDPSGGAATQVTAFGPDYSPNGALTWSPDGSTIAFAMYHRPTTVINLWRMRVR
jgi:hypothetical protein